MNVHDLLTLGSWLDRAGMVGILLVNLFVLAVGGHRGWFYSSKTYEEMREERNNWRTVAMGSIRLGHKAVDMAEDSLGIEK